MGYIDRRIHSTNSSSVLSFVVPTDIVERILGDSIVDETDTFVDNMQTLKVDRGETFEWARLRLLDAKIVDEMLSAGEVSAVTAHLKINFDDSFKLLTDSQLTRLISETPVTTFSKATQDVGTALPKELLYEKGVANDAFTLILSGKITIFVGEEGFRSDLSSWSVLGKSALDHASWVPDFTAYVSDGPCRCIRIHRAAFAQAVDASAVERRVAESKVGLASYDVGVEAISTMSVGESGRSAASSTDGERVPNRRGIVLKRLFEGSGKNIAAGATGDDILRNGKDTTVQFVEGDAATMDGNSESTHDRKNEAKGRESGSA